VSPDAARNSTRCRTGRSTAVGVIHDGKTSGGRTTHRFRAEAPATGRRCLRGDPRGCGRAAIEIGKRGASCNRLGRVTRPDDADRTRYFRSRRISSRADQRAKPPCRRSRASCSSAGVAFASSMEQHPFRLEGPPRREEETAGRGTRKTGFSSPRGERAAALRGVSRRTSLAGRRPWADDRDLASKRNDGRSGVSVPRRDYRIRPAIGPHENLSERLESDRSGRPSSGAKPRRSGRSRLMPTVTIEVVILSQVVDPGLPVGRG